MFPQAGAHKSPFDNISEINVVVVVLPFVPVIAMNGLYVSK